MKKENNNYLDKIFIKNDSYKWDIDDKNIVTIYVENKGLFNLLAQKLFRKPRISQIHLEEFGSFIWCQIDGNKSVFEIGRFAEAQFGDRIKPTYERLSVYMRQLADSGFVKEK